MSHAFDIDGRPYIYGGTSSGMIFPINGLGTSYTFFSRARYNGASKRRIFTSTSSCNWLSGFHDSKAGVAYHGSWITPEVDFHGSDWVISSDQTSLYRSNGVTRGNSGGATGSLCNLGVNLNPIVMLL